MLEIQILLSLLFRTDFPGYRGLQYVHNFLVFWVISNSPAMACLWIPMLTLHIHSQHLRLYLFLPWLEAIVSDLSFLLPAQAPPCQRHNSYISDIDLLMVRHTSKKLLALLNHSLWGVHIAGRKQSFTSWGVHITGINWEFSSAVEKSSRHCPGTEIQHKQGHTSNMLCRIQKNYHCQRCIEICQDITLQQGEQQWHQMARQTLGDFHINLQLPLSHIQWSQFQQGMVQEIIQQFGPTQIVLFELLGEIGTLKRHVLAIKRSIKELWHLTYFTDFIIVHGVQCAQCCNLWGCWIQTTYTLNAAIPRESCED